MKVVITDIWLDISFVCCIIQTCIGVVADPRVTPFKYAQEYGILRLKLLDFRAHKQGIPSTLHCSYCLRLRFSVTYQSFFL